MSTRALDYNGHVVNAECWARPGAAMSGSRPQPPPRKGSYSKTVSARTKITHNMHTVSTARCFARRIPRVRVGVRKKASASSLVNEENATQLPWMKRATEDTTRHGEKTVARYNEMTSIITMGGERCTRSCLSVCIAQHIILTCVP